MEHFKYPSLENINGRLESFLYEDVLIQEKIHGCNVCICGKYEDNKWNIKLGSRTRWIEKYDKFYTIEETYETNKENILSVFNELKNLYTEKITIRLFGELFGGKYGKEISKNAMRIQKEPNYCPFNDFAFFDIMINGEKIDVLKTNELLEKNNLKIAPIIYKGKFIDFYKTFDINNFNSVISEKFYNLPFIDTLKSTEGVTIRKINPSNNRGYILKYKKEWALEISKKSKQISLKKEVNITEVESMCYYMINENRFNSYKSKNTLDDLLNKKLLFNHLQEIAKDILVDVEKEFGNKKFNVQKLQKKLSQKICPLFKIYLKEIDEVQSNKERIELLEKKYENFKIDIDFIRNKFKSINTRIQNL